MIRVGRSIARISACEQERRASSSCTRATARQLAKSELDVQRASRLTISIAVFLEGPGPFWWATTLFAYVPKSR